MKKIVKILVFILMINCTVVCSAQAEIVDKVLSTNIGCLIDDMPIESYNINDYTFVVAEDLKGYGFDVIWDADERTLKIKHNVHKIYEMPLDVARINIRKKDIIQRKHIYDVYETDIKTYLEEVQIPAYNINGKTLIQVDNLAQYGTFNYYDDIRIVDIKICKPSFEYGIKISNKIEETEINIKDRNIDRNYKYIGELKNGKPEGIGKLINYEFENFTYAYWSDDNSYSVLGKYNGWPNNYGLEYSEDYDKQSNTTTIRYGGFPINGDGAKGYSLSVSVNGKSALYMERSKRNEQILITENPYRNVLSYNTIYTRSGIYDFSYLYGFKIEEEHTYNK